MSSPIIINKVFSGESIAASGSATYDFEMARSDGYEGFFSIQVQIVSGAGQITVDFLESNNGEDYVDQGAASDIVTGLSGAGHTMYSFDPMVCNKLRIRVTETGGVAGVVINAWLAVQ